MADERTERNRAIDMAIASIEKQFGKGSIMRLGEGYGCSSYIHLVSYLDAR
jgi:RecA/RadA recombinase